MLIAFFQLLLKTVENYFILEYESGLSAVSTLDVNHAFILQVVAMCYADFLGVAQKVGEENHIVARSGEHGVSGHVRNESNLYTHVAENATFISP